MGGKGGVIAAAVLHMKDQRDIQYTRFQICILAVRPENMENIFRGGKLCHGRMNKQAGSIMVMLVRLVSVDR